jgi:hypothetical protein
MREGPHRGQPTDANRWISVRITWRAGHHLTIQEPLWSGQEREVSLVLFVVEDLDESRRLSTAALAPSATPNSTCRQTVCTTGPGLAAALAGIAAFDRRDRVGA